MKSKFLKEIMTELKSIGPELKEAMGKNKVEIVEEPVIEDVYEEEPVIEEIYEDEVLEIQEEKNNDFEEMKESGKEIVSGLWVIIKAIFMFIYLVFEWIYESLLDLFLTFLVIYLMYRFFI